MPRIVFAGASTPIQKVLERAADLREQGGLDLAALFTETGASPDIEARAAALGMAVHDVALLKRAKGAELLRFLAPDWFLSVNTTVIFPEKVITIPARGALNMHPGLLPEYAGLHTHQWAIRNGETRFGVTLHWMEPSVDAGPIAAIREVEITPRDTGLSLFVKCQNACADLVAETLALIARGETPARTPQNLSRRKLYTGAMARDGRINWNWSARQVADFVRAADYAPFTCPTYAPTTAVGGKNFIVRKATATDETCAAPGVVATADEQGIGICAKDGRAVRLTAIEWDGKKLRGEAIAEALDLFPGDPVI